MKMYDHHRLVLILILNMMFWMILVGSVCVMASHVLAMEGPHDRFDSPDRIILAARAVDHAWEEFHRSAIGGTLASPMIQTQIEHQLHEARGLLMGARKAERAGDLPSVRSITDEVINLTELIIASSRERKQ